MFPAVANGWKLDTSALQKHIPLFQDKMGKHKELDIRIKTKSWDVQFGKYDTDIIAQYTLCLDVR